MGRKKRIWNPNLFYHIVCRGNRQEPMFHDPDDFETFFYILHQVYEKAPFYLASYCIMTNHFHLQLRSSAQPVSKVMALINKRYVTYYNTRYQLCGHLFEKRFYDEEILSINGMLKVSRYIHLNPVRANMSQFPEQYAWSSFHSLFSSVGTEYPFFDKDILLNYFPGDTAEKQQQYFEYVYEGCLSPPEICRI